MQLIQNNPYFTGFFAANRKQNTQAKAQSIELQSQKNKRLTSDSIKYQARQYYQKAQQMQKLFASVEKSGISQDAFIPNGVRIIKAPNTTTIIKDDYKAVATYENGHLKTIEQGSIFNQNSTKFSFENDRLKCVAEGKTNIGEYTRFDRVFVLNRTPNEAIGRYENLIFSQAGDSIRQITYGDFSFLDRQSALHKGLGVSRSEVNKNGAIRIAQEYLI